MVQAAQREHRTIDRPPISSEKLMNKSFNKAGQAGFTMIELIVVIVILGILAATAMPKFTSLSGDARKASLQAARGALSASSAMIHGKYLVDPSKTSIAVEGNTAVGLTNGYPSPTDDFAKAAGLGDDYKATASATSLKIEPNNIPPSMTKCFITYTPATAGGIPSITTPDGYTCD
jgi:MSHA pilin protein MshA